MKGRLLFLVLAIVILVAASLRWHQEEQGAELFPSRSTFSTRPGGYKALYLTLEELGLPRS